MGAHATTDERVRSEWLKCSGSFAYFVHNYCHVYDATERSWIPFHLWPAQLEVAHALVEYRLNVILKARQLGMTWLALCFILWRMLFFPAFTALIFSRREIEAIYLLSKDRLRGIYNRLPSWMQVRTVVTDSSHAWQLSNGSVAYGFPTSAGDSYTASYALVDEADLVPDLGFLMNAVKPTIDGGGGMCLLSRSEKTVPNSMFKKTYLAARAGKNGWHSIFLPWQSRPGRTLEWYEEQKSDILFRTGALDDLYQQYPATDDEALKPPTLDRRIPYSFLQRCYHPMDPLDEEAVSVGIPFLKVFQLPRENFSYVIGGDPAEGNPTSDDSVAHVMNADDGEECAVMSGKIDPDMFAEYMVTLSRWYNNAAMLPERNNHGHAVILAIKSVHEESVAWGWDMGEGWMSSVRGKKLMYTTAVEAFRDNEVIIHSADTFTQLASIEGATLKAPEGSHDDFATSYCLAICAKRTAGASVEMGGSPTYDYRG